MTLAKIYSQTLRTLNTRNKTKKANEILNN